MGRKQTRRSVSVQPDLAAQIEGFAEEQGSTVSGVVETVVLANLGSPKTEERRAYEAVHGPLPKKPPASAKEKGQARRQVAKTETVKEIYDETEADDEVSSEIGQDDDELEDRKRPARPPSLQPKPEPKPEVREDEEPEEMRGYIPPHQLF